MESRRLLPPSRSPSQYPLFFSTPDLATDISEAAALPALDDPQHTGSDSAASSESGSTTPRRRASLSYDPSESGSTTASSTPTRAPSVTQGIPKPECLHQACVQVLAEISDMKAEIKLLKEEFAALKIYDDEEQPSNPQSLSSCRQNLFDELATETIGEIFSYAYPIVDLPSRIVQDVRAGYYRPNPEILSMICKRWRAISATNHSLWAAITIQNRRINQDDWETWGFQQLRSCLGKSGAYPLSIRIDGYSETDDSTLVISSILDIVMLHSERWRSIVFQFGLGREFLQKFDTINGRLPLLEYVELMLSEDRYSEDVPECRAFLSAPILSGIGIIPCLGMDVLRKIRLPRTQISEVTFRSCDFGDEEDFREMLGCMSVSLTSLTFSESFMTDDEDTVGPFSRNVTLPQLRRLRLLHDCGDVLDLLICPSLEELEIFSLNEGTITRFLDCSSCSLSHFKLCSLNNYDPRTYETVLKHPSLSTLRSISRAEMTDPGLELLNFNHHQIFPSLETLHLYLRIERYRHGDEGMQPQLLHRIGKLRDLIDSRESNASLHQPEFHTDDHQSESTKAQCDARTSLKNCLFHFNLEIERPEEVDCWDEEPILALQSFCISRKIIVSLKISYSWDIIAYFSRSDDRDMKIEWDLDSP